MKNKILISVLFMLGSLSILFGQKIVEKKMTMSLGPQNSFFVEVDGGDKKMAEKVFETYVKPFGKIKYNRKAKESYMMGTVIPLINGGNAFDLYVKFDDGKDQSTTFIWVDINKSFVGTQKNPQISKGINQFLTDYYVEVRKEVVAEELKNEEKNLSNLEKDFKKLQDKNQDYYNDIEKAKLKILELEKDIERNFVEQDVKVLDINTQKRVVEKVTDKLNSLGKKLEK